MSSRRPRSAIENSSSLRFWISLAAAFCLTVTYPIALLVTLPAARAFQFIRNEVAWSFHAVFLIPIAAGLLASAFNLEFFLKLAFWKRCAWALVFPVMIVLLFFAVKDDTKVFPTADRISAANGLQAFAIKVDECLRDRTCKDADKYLGFVPECRKQYEKEFPMLQASKGFEKAQAYFCALLQKTGGKPIPGNVVASLIFVLKYALIIFVWSFIYYTFFVAANYFFEIDKSTLYLLLGCFVIFVTWFPCQLYAEWYEWYGDLSHVAGFYGAFWLLLTFAFLLLLLFAAWAAVLIKKANLITTVAAIHTMAVTAFAIVFGTEPSTLEEVFRIFRGLSYSLFLVLMFIILLYIVVYIRLVMIAGADTSKSRPAVRRRAAGRAR